MLSKSSGAIALLVLVSLAATESRTQNAPPANVAGIPVNYDEALVGKYILAAPWMMANGQPVRDANTWFKKRRPEIVSLFEENQFGRSPGKPNGMSFDVFDKGTPALDGKALRRQVTIYFSSNKSGPKIDLLIYLPANAGKRVPLFLNTSFTANSSAIDDSGIKPGEVWGRDKKGGPAPKGQTFGRVAVAPFLAAGMGA